MPWPLSHTSALLPHVFSNTSLSPSRRHLSLLKLLPALQPLPVASLASPGPPHPALALVSLPVGCRVRRSEHVPQVHFIWLPCNTKLDSPVCTLLPFVSSNTCLKRQESQNSLSLHSTGTSCCHSTSTLDHSTPKLQEKTNLWTSEETSELISGSLPTNCFKNKAAKDPGDPMIHLVQPSPRINWEYL